MLQWGRNLTVAEGVARVRFQEREQELQWGRNLTVAEGCGAPTGPESYFCRFNGAAT